MNGSAGPRIHAATGQRAPESGSVAGSGAQPLLENIKGHHNDNDNHNDRDDTVCTVGIKANSICDNNYCCALNMIDETCIMLETSEIINR